MLLLILLAQNVINRWRFCMRNINRGIEMSELIKSYIELSKILIESYKKEEILRQALKNILDQVKMLIETHKDLGKWNEDLIQTIKTNLLNTLNSSAVL
jgi:DNA-binding transcriptional regulator GbsR (MarR family)